MGAIDMAEAIQATVSRLGDRPAMARPAGGGPRELVVVGTSVHRRLPRRGPSRSGHPSTPQCTALAPKLTSVIAVLMPAIGDRPRLASFEIGFLDETVARRRSYSRVATAPEWVDGE